MLRTTCVQAAVKSASALPLDLSGVKTAMTEVLSPEPRPMVAGPPPEGGSYCQPAGTAKEMSPTAWTWADAVLTPQTRTRAARAGRDMGDPGWTRPRGVKPIAAKVDLSERIRQRASPSC